MDLVWNSSFAKLFTLFPQPWVLQPTFEAVQETNWIMHVDHAKVRFLCQVTDSKLKSVICLCHVTDSKLKSVIFLCGVADSSLNNESITFYIMSQTVKNKYVIII